MDKAGADDPWADLAVGGKDKKSKKKSNFWDEPEPTTALPAAEAEPVASPKEEDAWDAGFGLSAERQEEGQEDCESRW